MSSLQSGTLISNGIDVELTKEENFKTNPIQVKKLSQFLMERSWIFNV